MGSITHQMSIKIFEYLSLDFLSNEINWCQVSLVNTLHKGMADLLWHAETGLSRVGLAQNHQPSDRQLERCLRHQVPRPTTDSRLVIRYTEPKAEVALLCRQTSPNPKSAALPSPASASLS